MEKIKNYSNLEKILSMFKFFGSINEFNFSDFWQNLFILENDEKYKKIINFNFEENGDSFKFSNEFNNCILNEELFDEKNGYFSIIINSNKADDIISKIDFEDRAAYISLIDNYVKLNMKPNRYEGFVKTKKQ